MQADLAFVGLGSNLGNRTAHLASGLAGLRDAGLAIRALSSLYLTEPELGPGQDETDSHPWYVNCVAAVDGCADAARLLELCQAVEADHGRVRVPSGMQISRSVAQPSSTVPQTSSPMPQPRSLDLDILLAGSEVIEQPALQVPHPRMHERRFVLKPLCELDPGLRHPVRDATVRELLDGLDTDQGVWMLAPPLDQLGVGGDD